MPFDGNGLFTVYTPGNPVISGTTISSTAFNATTADFAAGLTNTLTKDGQTPATANIPLGGNKLTGVGNGTARTDALNVGQAQDSAITLITGVSGTNTIVGNITPSLSAYAVGQTYRFVAVGANTTGVTLNIDAKGAKPIVRCGGSGLSAGDIPSGAVVTVTYDGTNFQLTGGIGSFATLNSSADITVGNSVSVGSGGGFIPLNVRFGQAAMANNATGFSITALGAFAANGGTAASNTTAIGFNALLAATGVGNLAAGSGSGSAITTGAKNSIFGSFTGNQGGYDIRTSSNNVVLSDGDGNVKLFADASGNVGIGTASPGSKFVVSNSGVQGIEIVPASNLIQSYNRSTNAYNDFRIDASQLLVYTGTSPTERFRIDPAGNAGLGVVPSAWGGGYRALQIGTRAVICQGSNDTYIGNNWINDGANKYIGSAAASIYAQVSGQHQFLAAPSGTAGNAITFTQSLAVGLGTTLALEGATSAAGTGIAFPATQLASSNANTLDDYEEGTWTPTLTFGGGSTGMTYTINQGLYTKVGRQVTITGQLILTAKGSSTGAAVISGLPFVVQNNAAATTGLGSRLVSVTFSGVYHVTALVNTATLAIGQDTTAGAPSNLTDTNFSNTSQINILHTYFV